MIDLTQIKTILKLSGITGLKIEFDEEQKQITAHYIFRGIVGIRQITYQEIIDSLVIGLPEQPLSRVVDVGRELK